MTDVYLKYNPYKAETHMQVDGEPYVPVGKMKELLKERLPMWVDQLFDLLVREELNETGFRLSFHGLQGHYDDLAAACADYCNRHSASIELRHIPAEGGEDRVGELIALMERMSEGPFDELKVDAVRSNFEHAVGSDFPIAVVALMKAGKSTLINSLLGDELMPSATLRCTAKVTSIRNDSEAGTFVGQCFSEQGELLQPLQEVGLKEVAAFNQDDEIVQIDLTGSIPYIRSNRMNLVLIDTPGTDYALNVRDKEMTFRLIKDDVKPMVLYVINATKIGSESDSQLLAAIAKDMKAGGRQSRDRFMFVLSQVDHIDPDKTSVEDVIEEARTFLSRHAIDSPNIFPVSAELAKLVRMKRAGKPLTSFQEMNLMRLQFMFSQMPPLKLLQYAPLGGTSKQKLLEAARLAEERGDAVESAHLHSGIPAVEEAINEYLDKYAASQKITTAVHVFQDIISSKQLEMRVESELAASDEKRASVHEQMSRMQEEIERGQKAAEFRRRIGEYAFDAQDVIAEAEGKIETEMIEMIEFFEQETKVEEERANAIIAKLHNEINTLQSDIKTDLEFAVLDVMQEEAERLLEEYRSYVRDLLEVSGGALQMDELTLFTQDLPDASSLVNRLKKQETVADGRKLAFKGKWYNPFTYHKWELETVYKQKTFVYVKDIMEKVVFPAKMSLLDNVDQANRHLQEEADKLRAFFHEEIGRLELLLKHKVNELRVLSGDRKRLERQVTENEQKREWLRDLVVRLDRTLEI